MKKIIAVVLLVIVMASLMAACEADYREGYHAATYTEKSYEGTSSSGPWALKNTYSITESRYNTFISSHGTSYVYEAAGLWYKFVVSYTPAY